MQFVASLIILASFGSLATVLNNTEIAELHITPVIRHPPVGAKRKYRFRHNMAMTVLGY